MLYKCEYWSKYKQHLQRHTLSIPDGVTYQCKECDNSYTDKVSLSWQVLAKHNGDQVIIQQLGHFSLDITNLPFLLPV